MKLEIDFSPPNPGKIREWSFGPFTRRKEPKPSQIFNPQRNEAITPTRPVNNVNLSNSSHGLKTYLNTKN
jgi:hypothetical protein